MKKLIALSLLLSAHSYGQDLILKPYQSIRSSGMGGLKLTTGLYDQNVFGNPARATANPVSRFSIFDVMVEANSNGISNAGDLAGAENAIAESANTAGENNHLRVQTTFPGFYKAPAAATETEPAGKMAWSAGIFTSTQTDLLLLRSFDASIGAIVDAGLHGTVARKLMENDELSVGLNAHFSYRGAFKPNYTLVNLIRQDKEILAAGANVDFDLGGTYQIPLEWQEFKFEGGAVLSNILGGQYTIAQSGTANVAPPEQPRSFGFGMAARRASLWVFSDAVFGLEFQDIGNNGGGSLFRTVHLGGEARYGVLAPRLGFNQGYFAAGLGVLTRFFTLELATYGEELGLNMGDKEDRRFALRIAAQI